MLNRVIEEFEHRLASQCDLEEMKNTSKDMSTSAQTESSLETSSFDIKVQYSPVICNMQADFVFSLSFIFSTTLY